jgi:signal transduction histidine kinase
LERRVAERTAQLEVAVREQEAFSYSVSHEMRTWLNHVRGFGQLLFDYYGERLGDEGREFLGHIIDSSAKIDQVIDDLLNLSSTARRELCFEMVELGPTAEEVVDGLRILYPERRVEFICTCAGAVRGDPGLLRLLLENLLKNAWKFTAERDAALIEFGVTRDNGRSVFFVRDNGIGFDMAFAEKIFQPFQRLSPEEYDGSGIGLATVRRIVHRHGGRIWAVGEPGEGASFYFTL